MNKKPAISFDQYLKRRGYMFLSLDQAIFKMLKKSFQQRSFCGFWRMWNPLSGYLFFHLYSFIGGNRKRPYAIFFVFLTSGFIFHDLVIYLVTGSISIVFTSTFSIYSMIFIIEHRFWAMRKGPGAYAVRKIALPLQFHVMLNMTLLALPLAIGFLINSYFFPYSVMNRLFH